MITNRDLATIVGILMFSVGIGMFEGMGGGLISAGACILIWVFFDIIGRAE